MKHKLLKLAYIRKRDRKSLLFVITILLFSSFSDDVILAMKQVKNSGSVEMSHEEIVNEGVEDKMVENHRPEAIDSSMQSHQALLQPSKRKIKRKDISSQDIALEIKKPSPIKDVKSDSIRSIPKKPIKKLSNIEIDPNSPNIDHLVAIGIPKKVAFTWAKYTKAGGKIHHQEDLKKIYGMEEGYIKKLENHMTFPKKLEFNKKSRLTSIFINKATAYEFSKIPGIGTVLSERITKFRDKLGGFHSVDQLKEVYGIEAALIDKYENLFLMEKAVTKININIITEEKLGAHSYCSYRVAKAIINYRMQHGNFTKAEDLLKIRIINKEWLDKISPYLEY